MLDSTGKILYRPPSFICLLVTHPMSYEPLHHKYRPQTFKDLVGQEAIANTLINAIKLEKIAPAYLFTGPRGTGKTSSARILAKSLNCLAFKQPTADPCGQCEVCRAIALGNALDVIEIDAASNTGVDNIREIIERSRFAPVQSRYKVYAIDECHMLSTAAFNALLKTLEEPPPQVVFILATTDPQRVLSTIISRCQRFDYRRIRLEAMVEHLQYIAEREKIAITTEALTLNAQIANGGLRDAESLLDQLSLFPEEITVDKIWDLVGAVPERDLLALLKAIRLQDVEDIVVKCRNLLDRGREPLVLLQNLAGFYLNLLIAKTSPKGRDLVAVTETCWEQLSTEAHSWQFADILSGQQHLKEAEVQIKNTTQPRLWLEITLLGLLNKTAAPPKIGKQSANLTPQNTRQSATATNFTAPQEEADRPSTRSPQDSVVPIQDRSVNRISPTETKISEKPVTTSTEPVPSPTSKEKAIASNGDTAIRASENNSTADNTAIWQQVIECIHPPMTQALLRQQCHLISLSDSAAIVGISSAPLHKMNQGKVPNIETAFAKVCGRTIKVTLEIAGLPDRAKKNSNLARNPNLHRGNSHSAIANEPVNSSAKTIESSPTPQVALDDSAVEKSPIANSPQAIEPIHSVTEERELIQKSARSEKQTVTQEEVVVQNSKGDRSIESSSAENSSLIANADDFERAVELIAQKFAGEIVEFKDSFSSVDSSTKVTEAILESKSATDNSPSSPTKSEISEGVSTGIHTKQYPLGHFDISSTNPEHPESSIDSPTVKAQKVVIRRESVPDYDDDDVPF